MDHILHSLLLAVRLLSMQRIIDVIVTKTVNRNFAVLGQGDQPTFDFTITLTAAAGSQVLSPSVIDSMSPDGLEIQGAVQPAGESRSAAVHIERLSKLSLP
jgi:hypothetical protein